MNIITQNPFRVLGLTGNATEKELQKQIGIIKRYAEVGKTKSFDYDFEFIGNFERNTDEIQQASNKIEQAHKKLLYSLFWFVKNTQFDEIAFNNLKENDTEKAIEIWNKTLKEEITTKNYSSYLNLSTLYIALSTIAEQIDLQKLQAGISLKGNLIHSESLKDFSKLVTGNGISNDPNEISKKFVDEVVELLKPYLNKRSGISTNDLISFFNSYPSSIQKYIAAKFTEVPISAIENKIEKTTQKRKNNPRDAEEYGEELYKSTKSDITLLKKLMGSSNVQYQMLANKLANEILQCSIDFFNTLRDEGGEFDPGEAALKVAKYAKAIGTTGQTKSRIIENTEVIQEWVDDKPNRQRQEAIAEDLAFVTNKLQRFQNLSDSINNSRDLVVSCKPKLTNIKNELGSYDDFYLQVSSAVVSNALGMIIEVVNREQSQLQYDRTKIISLPTTISSAVSVIDKMEYFDMVSEVRNRFDTNKRTIKGIKSQLDAVTNATRSYSSSSSNSSSSGGCYIATMAYGDYDHPQVQILRKFRDESLAASIFGRSFIRFYYATSPHLVSLLKNHERINQLIRNLLDKLVNKVK
nr:CFI-box-CTERM domain-containing protein [uncultured Draconibacterium sp.]